MYNPYSVELARVSTYMCLVLLLQVPARNKIHSLPDSFPPKNPPPPLTP